MKKKFAALVVSGLLMGLIVAPTAAEARPFAGVATCNVQLPNWPGSGSAGCSGTAVGVDVANPTVCAATCSFFARVDNYGETCVLGEPPLVGTANGEMFAAGQSIGRFTWLRVGLTAVLVPPDAAGVAAFAPLTVPPPTCENPGPLNAQVAGVAVSL